MISSSKSSLNVSGKTGRWPESCHTHTHKLLLENITQSNNDSFAYVTLVAVLLNPEINRKP